MFLTGFAIGTLIAAWMFIRVARESVPMSPEEAILVERIGVPVDAVSGPIPEGWEPWRAQRERIEGMDEWEVVLLRGDGGAVIRMQRGVDDGAGESGGDWELVRADRLEVVSKPRIESRIMRDGFEHTGFAVLGEDEEGVYTVGVDAFPADAMARARYFLVGRERFVAEVRFARWDGG